METFARTAAQLRELREWVGLARQQTGKSALQQLNEIQRLKKYGGLCGASDYYWYRLYDDAYLKGRGRCDFLGWRLQGPISLALNARNAVLPAWDKCVFMTMAASANLPVVPMLACFHRAKRISDSLGIHLKSRKEVGAFLRGFRSYPLFGKPAYSQQGFGSICVAGYDPSTDSLRLQSGSTMPLESFLDRIEATVDRRYHKAECGFLFQKSLTSATEISALNNWPAICGARVVCLNGPEGAKPIRAIWKIAIAPNQIDNFRQGRIGNLLADINLETGEIGSVVDRFWPTARMLVEHPGSHKSLVGFRLPGWEALLDACRDAGAVFPLMKIHHWDFALTDQGPLILELNDLGATEFVQLHGHGLLTGETREFLARHGDITAHPWIRHLVSHD